MLGLKLIHVSKRGYWPQNTDSCGATVCYPTTVWGLFTRFHYPDCEGERYQGSVHSWTKVYRIFFSVSCQTHSKWNFWGFLELGIKVNQFFLNVWSITYLGPAVTVQCPKTISNLPNFRCPPRSRVGKMWKPTISTIYWISNKASIFVFRDMKYHTR